MGCASSGVLDFWGPVSNFGIPVAAVMDTQKDPEMYVSVLFFSLLPSVTGIEHSLCLLQAGCVEYPREMNYDS